MSAVADPYVPSEIQPPPPPTEQFFSGGGGAASDSIDYSGPPLVNPPSLQSIVVDKDYRQWQYGPNGWQ